MNIFGGSFWVTSIDIHTLLSIKSVLALLYFSADSINIYHSYRENLGREFSSHSRRDFWVKESCFLLVSLPCLC